MNINRNCEKSALKNIINSQVYTSCDNSTELQKVLSINHLDMMMLTKLPICNLNALEKEKVLKAKLDYNKNLSSLRMVIQKLSDSGIDYRIIKGVLIAESYPFVYSRLFGDHDLLIRKRDLEKAMIVLQECGYYAQNDIKTSKDISLFRENFNKIELHFDIADEKKGTMTNKILEMIWEKKHDYNIDGQTLIGPEPQTHLIYMVYHILKHFTNSGFGFRHLIDLKYFIEKHSINLHETDYFFAEFGYEKFFRNLIMLCADELEMNFNYQSQGWIRNEFLQETLFEYVAKVGTFGNGTKESTLTNLYDVKSNGDLKTKKWNVFINLLFPSKNDLGIQYPFVKKNSFLLPLAWSMRAWKQLFNKKYSFKEKMFVFTLDKSLLNHKVYLLKEFGIRKSEV